MKGPWWFPGIESRLSLRFNLIFHDNKAGAPNSAALVRDALIAMDGTVAYSPLKAPGIPRRIATALRKIMGSPLFDANIFMEHIVPEYLALARHNILIPNQEWFEPRWKRHLPRFSAILCKPHEAERQFMARGLQTSYIGFSAQDRRKNLGVESQFTAGALHIAGRSLQKGTGALIRVWLKHPEWPLLTVVQRPPHPGYELWHPPAENIRYQTEYLPDAEIQSLQNRFSIHICPSEAEGFGHALAESMSCGAVLITTDAPPMNELVRPSRGVLVPYSSSASQGFGTKYLVDETALEKAIAEVFLTPVEELQRLGRAAREWYENNDKAFQPRFQKVIAEVLGL